MFGCKHDWQLIDKTITESAFEQMSASGQSLKLTGPTLQMFKKIYFWWFRCSKCSKLRKEREVVYGK